MRSLAAAADDPRRPAGAARRRRPGTAVSKKGRARSEAILEAAAALLVEEGYAQLSTRKLAARAGMGLGNLQYYYPTKQDVVRDLLDRSLARALAAIERRVSAGDGTAASRLQACLDGVLDDLASPAACRMFWEIWALAARDPSVARATRSFYTRYRDGVAALLRALAPGLGAARAERRATLAVAMLEGLTVFRLGAGPTALAEPAFAQELRSTLLQLAGENLA
jgi:AcrR family transcriptional regulator